MLGTCCVKVSVLLFYRRMRAGTFNKRWMWLIHGAIAFTVLYTMALILALIFSCIPVQAYWKSLDPTWNHKYSCADTFPLNTGAGVLSVFSDVYAVVLPCVMLQGLEIGLRQKIGLNVVFAMSLSVVLAGCFRTWTVSRVANVSDVTWYIHHQPQKTLICVLTPRQVRFLGVLLVCA